MDHLSDSKTPRILKFKNFCRVCAKESRNMINLFCIRKKGLRLADMLAICIQSEIIENDSRPSNICMKCIQSLESAFDFYNLAKASENRYIEMCAEFGSSVKSPSSSTSETLNVEILDTDLVEGLLKIEPAEENIDNDTHFDEVIIEETTSLQLNKNHSNRIAATKKSETKHAMNPKDIESRKRNRLFECFLCKEKIKTYKETRAHLTKHDLATPHKCRVCSMRFSRKYFNLHLCQGQVIQCEYCTSMFDNTMKLLEHLECHEDKNLYKWYKCTDCSKMFAMSFLLEAHKRQHNDMEKPHVCNVCNRGFRANFLLNKHMQTHSEARRE